MTTKKKLAIQSLGRQLNFATGRMNALCKQALEPYGLSLPQWVILSCIWREGPLTVRALSEFIGTGLPATSRILERMSEADLINRTRDQSDGRVTLVDVTEKGRSLDHLAGFYEDINQTLLEGFTRKERDLIFDLLQRIENNANHALK